ncbi:MAG: hypothetical protein NT015_12485 [Alphaproteobacteria bacterium]|nr:hypothetical protein [Alphaproteobacteria bacterium]
MNRAGCAIALVVACVALGVLIQLLVVPLALVLDARNWCWPDCPNPMRSADRDISRISPIVLFIIASVGVVLISRMPEKSDEPTNSSDLGDPESR